MLPPILGTDGRAKFLRATASRTTQCDTLARHGLASAISTDAIDEFLDLRARRG